MHLIGSKAVLITPPRTGTRTVLRATGNAKVLAQHSDEWHKVDPSLAKGKRLLMSVRNPYTRLQSFWRMYSSAKKKIGAIGPKKLNSLKGKRPLAKDLASIEISFEDYVMILETGQFVKSTANALILNDSEYGNLLYPRSLVSYLHGIAVKKVWRLLRQETLSEDLKALGLKTFEPLDDGVPAEKHIGIEWYDDYPALKRIVGERFKYDFDAFGYIR